MFTNQYLPLIGVAIFNLIVVFILYRELNAVKASVSQLVSAPTPMQLEFSDAPHEVDDDDDVPQEIEPTPVSKSSISKPGEKKHAVAR